MKTHIKLFLTEPEFHMVFTSIAHQFQKKMLSFNP